MDAGDLGEVVHGEVSPAGGLLHEGGESEVRAPAPATPGPAVTLGETGVVINASHVRQYLVFIARLQGLPLGRACRLTLGVRFLPYGR